MNMDKPMPLILIEDDASECNRFRNCARNRTDVAFVGITGSSDEGISFVKTRLPEGVILDLELHKGKGSGIQFLTDLNNLALRICPIVIVTTNSPSAIVYNHIHDMGVDLIFYKRQENYSPDMIINTLVALRKSLYNALPKEDHLKTLESPEELRGRIIARIDAELELVGIRERYKGRQHLQDAIYLMVTKAKDNSESILYQVAKKRKISYSSVIRAIQTAINNAWENNDIDELLKHYTARININTGVPSPTDFIYFYAAKIQKSL